MIGFALPPSRFAASGFAPLLRCGKRPAELAILVFTCTTTVAVFWEFFEFSLDAILGTGFQNSIGDTLKDIVLAMLGAMVVLMWFHGKLKQEPASG